MATRAEDDFTFERSHDVLSPRVLSALRAESSPKERSLIIHGRKPMKEASRRLVVCTAASAALLDLTIPAIGAQASSNERFTEDKLVTIYV